MCSLGDARWLQANLAVWWHIHRPATLRQHTTAHTAECQGAQVPRAKPTSPGCFNISKSHHSTGLVSVGLYLYNHRDHVKDGDKRCVSSFQAQQGPPHHTKQHNIPSTNQPAQHRWHLTTASKHWQCCQHGTCHAPDRSPTVHTLLHHKLGSTHAHLALTTALDVLHQHPLHRPC
jgi:hypothetical protein